MKLKPFLIFGLLVGVVSLFAFYPKSPVDPKEKEALIIKAILNSFNHLHFNQVQIDDNFSSTVYNDFLKALDGGKRFLTQADIDKLSIYEKRLDTDLSSGKFDFFDQSMLLLDQGITNAKAIYTDILAEPLKFDVHEDYDFDFDQLKWAKNQKELKDRWRKAVKADVLEELVIMQRVQEPDSSGKVKDDVKVKSNAELEQDARAKVKKDLDLMFGRLSKLERVDRLSDFLNVITNAYDPHSTYLSPEDKEDFNFSMSGKLEGIGAKLQSDGEFTKVVEIVAGGPAWKQKELQSNDVIIKVRQENEPEALDIKGMRIDEVVSKIRGKKGTKVTLTVKKTSGDIKNITIERDEVLMEERFAKSAIINKEGVIDKVGYIYLPMFYMDLDNNKGRFSFTDIKEEIRKLNQENVNGIILDLRNNPGGSLTDVIKMSGLFIEGGPVVQVKSRDQDPYKMSDDDNGYDYDGPLVILVNHNSASASEIIAAALQDYNRAIVMGSSSTYGKGTVQRIFDLDRTIGDKSELKPLGQVKVTIQKYYRINGGSVQLKGVIPDIVMPDPFNYISMGEKDNEHALAWTSIQPTNYSQKVFVIKNKDEIIQKSQKRIAANPTFAIIDENAKRFKKERDDKTFSLDLNEYKSDLDKKRKEDKMFNEIFKEIPGLMVDNLSIEKTSINSDSVKTARNNNFLTNLKKDVYVDEAINVIADLQVNRMAKADRNK